MASTPATAIEAHRTLSSVDETWRAKLVGRMRGHLLLTFIGTSALTFAFFIGYFYVQQHPISASAVMPTTALDDLIPFQPLALIAYLSLWIYVGAGPGLQATRAEVGSYALWSGALCLTGLTIFYFFPTRIAEVGAAQSDSVFFRTLQEVDASGNACPSMHVAIAVFTGIRVDAVLRLVRSPRLLRLFNVACCALICYSTLAVKQHVVLDVVAGAVLGALFAGLSMLAWRATPANRPVR
jgi:membrane-associated phospholipid phosphatase